MGILPPGDFRNCIAALADDESLITRLFQYRFATGKDLEGHSFGNLFISAMVDITGTFESALHESSRVLAVQGQVLPSTLDAVHLCADIQIADGAPVRVCGESRIPEVKGRILRVTLEPGHPKAYPGALKAILDADIVIIGPGSLYTSIMPNLLVPEIIQALQTTPAPKVYVCNIVTQPGETDNYSARAHLAAVEQTIGKDIISTVILTNTDRTVHQSGDDIPVTPDLESGDNLKVIRIDSVDPHHDWRHDSHSLGSAIMELVNTEY
ncbi:MAG: YvcK family protein [Anaerolineae bacterium]|nr:YvcK family protein [Anaerolineae bacterium]